MTLADDTEQTSEATEKVTLLGPYWIKSEFRMVTGKKGIYEGHGCYVTVTQVSSGATDRSVPHAGGLVARAFYPLLISTSVLLWFDFTVLVLA